jgi:predicted heme/steroid binding protein
MERISQIEAASTFFHATGKAEIHSVKRTEDTLIYYYYYFNWGLDSYHGRTAIETLNQIHGRYYIHNDGMKYVLLDGAFTLLDTLEAMAHRKLTEHERLGYFHATVKMGRAMNIADLTDSYDEMRTWFYDVSRAFAAPAPQKLRMWNALEDNFDRGARVPWIIGRFRRLIENVSMDESYRSALGFTEPSKFEAAVCRSVVRGVTKVRSIMPPEANIESLQNFITYPNGATLEAAGEKARSERMPAVCPFSGKSLANHGYPEGQRPLQRVEDAAPTELPVLSWTEVKHHNTIDDLWVVFGGHVYDLSSFARNHPGGMKVLLNHAGRDASKAFEKAKHTDLTKVFSLNFRIGKIESPRVIENAELATAN